MNGIEALDNLPPENRMDKLWYYYSELTSHGPLSPVTTEYIRGGGSLRLSMRELIALSPPSEIDVAINEAREEYVSTVLHRPHFHGRNGHKERRETARRAYEDTLLAKVAAIVDSTDPKDAISFGQMPQVLDDATFHDKAPSAEHLAANQLYMLVDTLLKEHVARRQLISAEENRSIMAKTLGNRAVRMGLAGTVFVGTLSPRFGVFPEHGDIAVEQVELGIQVLTGIVFALDAPEVARLGFMDLRNARRTKELRQELASTKQNTDLALRIAYNNTRHGGSQESDGVINRCGTDDIMENFRRFDMLDDEFTHLTNDPGGKPYSGEQVLGYAARLLIERKDQLLEIMQPGKTAEERREFYIAMAQEVLDEDLRRMEKGLTVSTFRKMLVHGMAVSSTLLFPGALSSAGEAATLSRDTSKTVVSETKLD